MPLGQIPSAVSPNVCSCLREMCSLWAGLLFRGLSRKIGASLDLMNQLCDGCFSFSSLLLENRRRQSKMEPSRRPQTPSSCSPSDGMRLQTRVETREHDVSFPDSKGGRVPPLISMKTHANKTTNPSQESHENTPDWSWLMMSQLHTIQGRVHLPDRHHISVTAKQNH